MGVRSKFTPSKQEVIVKCDFKLQNIQASPARFTIPINNGRYWSKNTYGIVYFNNFLFCGANQWTGFYMTSASVMKWLSNPKKLANRRCSFCPAYVERILLKRYVIKALLLNVLKV